MERRIIKLAILTFVSMNLLSQTPGGVGSPEVWFKTVPVTEDKAGSYQWRDYGSENEPLYQSGSLLEPSAERAAINTYNFNPALPFTSAENRAITLKKSDLSQTTIIGVWGFKSADHSEDGYLYQTSGREDRLLTKTQVVHTTASGRKTYEYKSNLVRKNTPESEKEQRIKILTYIDALKPETSIWGKTKTTTVRIGGSFIPTEDQDFQAGSFESQNSKGYLPELIIYGRALKTSERMQVETYLALKYGITLGNSYISSWGELLWDINNKTYNKRITGYGRDDRSNFHQAQSTTSYEETYINIDDTYHQQNSYNQSSEYNLIVMGYQEGSYIQDKTHVLFADNGQSTAPAEEDSSQFKLMQRRWQLRTFGTQSQEIQTQAWIITPEMTLTCTDSLYQCRLHKPDTLGNTQASIISNAPLSGKTGYLTWKAEANVGPLIVKFGTENPAPRSGSQDYGYSITFEGQVHQINKGNIQESAIQTISSGDKIEIIKDEQQLYMRINDQQVTGSNLYIDTMHTQSPYYGSIQLGQRPNDSISIADVKIGGIENTGNKVELSYNLTQDSIFKHYRNGNIYLVIDRSGTGNFTTNVDYIPMDELDEFRSKAIFNHVQWDSIDIFTFAYSGDPMEEPEVGDSTQYEYTLTLKEPTCDGYNPLSDGEITLSVPTLSSGFDYVLKNQWSSLANGTTRADSILFTNLSAGTYTLYIAPSGAPRFNLYASSTAQAVTRRTFNSNQSGAIKWEVGDTQTNAKVAFMLSYYHNGTAQEITFDYGVKIEGTHLYPITAGAESNTPLTTLSQGDSIRLQRRGNQINIHVNGLQVGTINIQSNDNNYTCCVAVQTTGNHLKNLSMDNFAYDGNNPPYGFDENNPVFIYTTGMELEVVGGASYQIDYNITCTGETGRSASISNLTLYSNDGEQTKGFTAHVQLEEPQAVTILVFNANSVLVAEERIPGSGETHVQKHITVSTSGVYLVKAVAEKSKKEYDGKIVVP